ncbi:MAG: carbamoyltransferase HypF [Phycisphaerales bacterium]|nr:MAG: carbamoyltransferase HypF [Phycisphaerales bacterium]
MIRRAAKVTGLVQGIGFRPFVHRVASQLGLFGFVRNQGSHVLIHVEGAPATIDRFQRALTEQLPPLARVDHVEWQDCPPRNDRAFEIVASEAVMETAVTVAADVATCPDCLAELFDPHDRRYRYPFLNCTNCGPRLTIITGVPYDRVRTTMAPFQMCDACRREYEDPANRRFHAEPTACPVCGPRLVLYESANARSTGEPRASARADAPASTWVRIEQADPHVVDRRSELSSHDPLGAAIEALRRGRIVAIKGLGGYHFACLATNEAAVTRLRRRKHRDEKPFAIMVRDLGAARAICHVSNDEARMLEDARRPIVLLRRRAETQPLPHGRGSDGEPLPYGRGSDGPPLPYGRGSDGQPLPHGRSADGPPLPYGRGSDGEPLPHGRGSDGVAVAVAPGNPLLGVMLPYTPLHHLLMAGMDDEALVMTSGNRSDEPIAYEDADARERFTGIADCLLTHDRAIQRRCDDSIVRWTGGAPMILRRSRGYVPEPLTLPVSCRSAVLAVGGQLKATFALGQDERAIVSHHGGDLDDFAALRAYVQAIDDFERFFDVTPTVIVHDLHPDYATTRYAAQRCDERSPDGPRASARTDVPALDGAQRAPAGLERIAVQHHHAHLASCLADHQSVETAIGVIFDGTGYGLDGAVWGGEFLVGGLTDFRRAAHLRYVAMPGGEQAIREPWRMAAAHLIDATGNASSLRGAVSADKLNIVERMVAHRLNAPQTSSMGRLFDAVAALAGIRLSAAYEGQAAMELEWAATRAGTDGCYSFSLQTGPISDDAPGRPARSSAACEPRDSCPQTGKSTGADRPTTTPPPIERGERDLWWPMVVDTRRLIRDVLCDVRASVDPAVIARRFHSTVVEIIAAVCHRLRASTGLDRVALSGGVFMNVLLLEEATARLQRDGFRVYRQRRVPPNDGGLSFGQLAVAAARMRR